MRSRSLLVVDDDPLVGALVRDVARRQGFEASVAEDQEGFSRLYDAQRPPTVVVLDLLMPDTDGVQIIRHLARERCPSALLLVSGFDRRVLKTVHELATSHGLWVIGALTKPFSISELARLLDLAAGAQASRPEHLADPALTSADLDRGIRASELDVHYQPKVDMRDGSLRGVEALVRWRHPTQGLLTPSAFLHLANHGRLLERLSEQVLEQALARCGAWRASGLDCRVSVNLPVHALTHLDLPERLVAMAARAGLPPERLVVEVTERGVMSDLKTQLDVLTRLRMKGIGLSIDDFGTGYSTMEQLRRIPFDEMKLDRSFLTAARDDEAARIILRSSVELGRSLALRVVAEGVETLEDWTRMQALGCDQAQGFLIGHPMPGAKLAGWLGAWRVRAPTLLEASA